MVLTKKATQILLAASIIPVAYAAWGYLQGGEVFHGAVMTLVAVVLLVSIVEASWRRRDT